LKNRGNFLFLPLSFNVDWREREIINSDGLECGVCFVHFKWIKVEKI